VEDRGLHRPSVSKLSTVMLSDMSISSQFFEFRQAKENRVLALPCHLAQATVRNFHIILLVSPTVLRSLPGLTSGLS